MGTGDSALGAIPNPFPRGRRPSRTPQTGPILPRLGGKPQKPQGQQRSLFTLGRAVFQHHPGSGDVGKRGEGGERRRLFLEQRELGDFIPCRGAATPSAPADRQSQCGGSEGQSRWLGQPSHQVSQGRGRSGSSWCSWQRE